MAVLLAAREEGLVVVTNSLPAALLFDPDRHRIRVLPGEMAGPDGSLAGAETVRALADHRLDLALIGCSGIEPEGAVMDFDPARIAVKRMAMDVAARAVLLATEDKFGRSARHAIAPLARFHAVVTERRLERMPRDAP